MRSRPFLLPARRRWWVVGAIAVVGAVVLATGVIPGGPDDRKHSEAAQPRFAGAPIPPGAIAPGFSLHDQNGRVVRLSAEKGHLVLVTFLYTRCHDICPVIAAQLDHAARAFGKSSDKISVVAVSVDPVGDTPAAVRTYLRTHRLGPEFRWLVGTANELAPVWHAYNIQVANRNADVIAHTAPVYLVDANGRPRVYYAPPPSPRAIVHDLRLLLNA